MKILSKQKYKELMDKIEISENDKKEAIEKNKNDKAMKECQKLEYFLPKEYTTYLIREALRGVDKE